MNMHAEIRGLINCLALAPSKKLSGVIGLDGFVDEVVQVVNRRIDCQTYERIETIAEYGHRISNCAGMSCNIEMVVKGRKIGGNGTILAHALDRYGLTLTYIGTIGMPTPDPVFSVFSNRVELIGVANPGKTDAVEFLDGKIISSKLESLNQLRWADIKNVIAPHALAKKIAAADIVSFNNWTMIPAMSEIWRGILDDVLPLIDAEDIRNKLMFVDIADPEKRHAKDLLNAIALLKEFSAYGLFTVLGLNKKEALEIVKAANMEIENTIELEPLIRCVAAYVQLDGLVIHPVDKAGALIGNLYAETMGPFCAKPAITTGAGDHFNAGFVYGFLRKFALKHCLLLGVATSGYYVRHAQSPTIPQVLQFLNAWLQGELD